MADITLGSPPHTRDKSNFICSLGRASGIIPAYAGQIKTALEAIRKSEDHTRIRGTNSSVVQKVSGSSGSSPHTRDKSEKTLGLPHFGRLIPAYTGQIGIKYVRVLRTYNQE